MKKGFTLIELLVVVAIIGILAAIAVPNFVGAQLRAKYGRVLADGSALRTAMESYRLDNQAYPLDVTPPGVQDETFVWKSQTRAEFASLTTPTPYIATLPLDPFFIKGTSVQCAVGPLEGYCYASQEGVAGTHDVHKALKEFGIFWLGISRGTDGDEDFKYFQENPGALSGMSKEDILKSQLIFDPTNGLHSSGDIPFTQPQM